MIVAQCCHTTRLACCYCWCYSSGPPGNPSKPSSHILHPELAAMRDTQVRPTEHGTKVGRCLTHTLSPARGTSHRHTRTLLPDRSSHRRRRRTHSLFLVLASSAHTLQSKASREQVSGGRVCLLCVEKDTLFAEKVGTGSAGRPTRKLLAPWCGFQRQCPAPD